MIVFDDNARIAAWICEQLNEPVPVNPAAIGFTLHGSREIVGGVLYTNYRGCDIEMSCAAVDSRWLNRQHLDAIFGYPFRQLKCLRVTAITERRNKKARQFIERIGFRHEGSHPRAMNGRTALTYGLLREHCRWLIGDTHGQEKLAQATARA